MTDRDTRIEGYYDSDSAWGLAERIVDLEDAFRESEQIRMRFKSLLVRIDQAIADARSDREFCELVGEIIEDGI